MTTSSHPYLPGSVLPTARAAAARSPQWDERARRIAYLVGAHSWDVYPVIRTRDRVLSHWFVSGLGFVDDEGECLS